MIRAASAGLAVALALLVWALLHVGWYAHGQIVDYGVYSTYGNLAVHRHLVPYRDFGLVYPPGALPAFVGPALLDDVVSFDTAFRALMLVCFVAAVLAVLAIAGRRAAALAAVAPLLLGSIVLSRFDLWPAMLVAAALAALTRRRLVVSGLLLGTAFAAKLWPAALAPLVLVWLWRNGGRRAALAWAGAAVGAAVAWFAPFAVLSPGGVWNPIHLELARPLQVESLGAAILVAVDHVAGTSLHVVSTYGSQNLAGPGVQAVQVATSAVEAVALVAVWLAFALGPPTVERLLLACVAAVAALLAFGKVFSPQFLIWLLPLAALARGVVVPVLAGAAFVLTQAYFPERYWPLTRLDPAESWLVLARDLVVVAVFAAAAQAVAAASHGSTAASRARSSSAVSARSGARTSG